jgi:hypothetical protein
MLRLELRFKGNPRIAKEMETFFPGRTAKQIRDKRKDQSYKKLLEQYLGNHDTSEDLPLQEASDEVTDLHPLDDTDTPPPTPLIGVTHSMARDTTGPELGPNSATQDSCDRAISL